MSALKFSMAICLLSAVHRYSYAAQLAGWEAGEELAYCRADAKKEAARKLEEERKERGRVAMLSQEEFLKKKTHELWSLGTLEGLEGAFSSALAHKLPEVLPALLSDLEQRGKAAWKTPDRWMKQLMTSQYMLGACREEEVDEQWEEIAAELFFPWRIECQRRLACLEVLSPYLIGQVSQETRQILMQEALTMLNTPLLRWLHEHKLAARVQEEECWRLLAFSPFDSPLAEGGCTSLRREMIAYLARRPLDMERVVTILLPIVFSEDFYAPPPAYQASLPARIAAVERLAVMELLRKQRPQKYEFITQHTLFYGKGYYVEGIKREKEDTLSILLAHLPMEAERYEALKESLPFFPSELTQIIAGHTGSLRRCAHLFNQIDEQGCTFLDYIKPGTKGYAYLRGKGALEAYACTHEEKVSWEAMKRHYGRSFWEGITCLNQTMVHTQNTLSLRVIDALGLDKRAHEVSSERPLGAYQASAQGVWNGLLSAACIVALEAGRRCCMG